MASSGPQVRTARSFLGAALVSVLVLALGSPSTAANEPKARVGSFSRAFAEPTIQGKASKKNCVRDHDGNLQCKPTAGSIAVLPDGRILYWNALEGTENVKDSIGAEYGKVSINDQTRVLDLSGDQPRWSEPSPLRAGANPDGYETEPLLGEGASKEKYNDGALFCSDLTVLADGSVLAVGGTAYYNDPEVGPVQQVELEGLRNSRIFHPETNTWTQSGDMKHGRWYPTLVTLGNGDVFVASGVQKLLKPVYPSHPEDSGRNIVQTETYDPKSGKWSYNGTTADRSLPLYPRLHLLPNGHVFYNAAGQAFNPAGESYDEALWNLTATYDPKSASWTNLGLAGLGTQTPGFRGSSFSIMLPLEPDKEGRYTRAEFLSAGGVLGTSPGGYVAVPTSAITSVATGSKVAVASRPTSSLNHSRWYSTAIALPTGEVVAFSGADRDEVVAPGTGFPITQAELFDPETEEWRPVATSTHARTYHNSATLLPDGRVLVGGHAPITTLYGKHQTLPGGFSPNDGRDPSFEIFSPPYMFAGDRPAIRNAPSKVGYDDTFRVVVDRSAAAIDSVVLVRNPSLTHLMDADQRTVSLPVISRNGNVLRVAAPPNGNVAPPGPYMLFANGRVGDSVVPSVSAPVFVGR
ncbi:MAG: DUF1929 domain-containing protein [Actinomycetota bacterium]|nr:DUF1929 domain-containing protein [Actinomycetota bacterium]